MDWANISNFWCCGVLLQRLYRTFVRSCTKIVHLTWPIKILCFLSLYSLCTLLTSLHYHLQFKSSTLSNLLSLEDFPAGSITPINGSLSLDYLLNERLRSQPPPSPYNGTNAEKIPRIVHRTYKTSTVPSRWSRAWKTCKEFNPSYTHYFWTDESGRDFIKDTFPWFLPTYDNYPFPIQRVDALRYFLLWEYGGIYLDMDISCKRPLDPLLNQSAWLPKTWPYGVSNDAIASVPAHPFFIKAALSLREYDKSYVSKYLTVLFSTGPMFLNSVLAAWYNIIGDLPGMEKEGISGSGELASTYTVAILPEMLYSATEYTFFRHHKGSTWHGYDVAAVRWLYKHLFILVFLILAALIFNRARTRSKGRAARDPKLLCSV